MPSSWLNFISRDMPYLIHLLLVQLYILTTLHDDDKFLNHHVTVRGVKRVKQFSSIKTYMIEWLKLFFPWKVYINYCLCRNIFHKYLNIIYVFKNFKHHLNYYFFIYLISFKQCVINYKKWTNVIMFRTLLGKKCNCNLIQIVDGFKIMIH